MLLNMTDQMTALELVRRAQAPEPYKIVELMRLTNEMLIDIPAYECNSGTIHKTLQRTIKEVGEHRVYNQGVGSVSTQTAPIEDRTVMLEAYSRVDERMLQHSGNRNAARQSEAVGIIKGMGLAQARMLIKGDKNKPEEFDGIETRRAKVDGKTVISAGGTGSGLTSLYLVAVGPDLFHLLYPQGSKSVGVDRQDLGVMHVPQAGSPDKSLPMAVEFFTAQYGICVRDPSALVRICNIPGNVTGDALVDLIIEASYRLPPGASTYAMYSNDSVLIKLDKASFKKENVVHTQADPWGKPVTHVRNIRCRRMDAITNAESVVA